jgi:hypothetical protein
MHVWTSEDDVPQARGLEATCRHAPLRIRFAARVVGCDTDTMEPIVSEILSVVTNDAPGLSTEQRQASLGLVS